MDDLQMSAGIFAGTLRSGSTDQHWTPPGRVIVAINDAPPVTPPVLHMSRPDDR